MIHGGVVGEIEAQAARVDDAAGLLDVRAEHLAQRGVQQVGRGVVAHGGVAQIGVDLGDARTSPTRMGACAVTRCTVRPGTRGKRRLDFRDLLAAPVE